MDLIWGEEPNAIDYAIKIVILAMSLSIHEFAHAAAGLWAGDTTAKDHGRMTLNPLKHLELTNSLILPLVILIGSRGQLLFGGAKPTPYDPFGMSTVKRLSVALAGPLSNVLVGLAAVGILLGMASVIEIHGLTYMVLMAILFINALLAIFNMLPVPGLDGAQLIRAVLPERARLGFDFLEQHHVGLVILVILLLTGSLGFLFPVLGDISSWVTDAFIARR